MTEPTPPIEQHPPTSTSTSTSQATQKTEQGKTTFSQKVHLPRIAIKFCTQCRWMLRAAYFAQELLSTFNTDLGEVSLVPMTGGVFSVTIWHTPSLPSSEESAGSVQETLLWDRKRDGGFPEVKVLKSLVRNVIDPNRDLGHTDRALKKQEGAEKKSAEPKKERKEEKKEEKKKGAEEKCEDCV